MFTIQLQDHFTLAISSRAWCTPSRAFQVADVLTWEQGLAHMQSGPGSSFMYLMYPRALSSLPASAIPTVALLSFHICLSATVTEKALLLLRHLYVSSPVSLPGTLSHTAPGLLSVTSLGVADAFIFSSSCLERFR